MEKVNLHIKKGGSNVNQSTTTDGAFSPTMQRRPTTHSQPF